MGGFVSRGYRKYGKHYGARMKNYKTSDELREKMRVRAEKRRRSLGIKTRITSFDERFESKCEPIPVTGCVIWLGHVGHSGHGQVFFNGKLERTHRVAWIKANGDIPEGVSVLHKCDVASCVNPNHLFLGTQKDNMSDMRLKNRGAIGSMLSQTKLNTEKVKKILSDNRGVTFIARDYGVTPATIDAIRTGKTWKHVSGL